MAGLLCGQGGRHHHPRLLCGLRDADRRSGGGEVERGHESGQPGPHGKRR